MAFRAGAGFRGGSRGFRPGFGGVRPGFGGFFPGLLFGTLLGGAAASPYYYPPYPSYPPYPYY